ncbi:MAG TPA: lmo0937 family membrane protein [Thermoanaerobaculia bacterium]
MNLLWLIVLVLVILWLAGFSLNIGGSLIHLLVVIALVIIIWRLATGKRVV